MHFTRGVYPFNVLASLMHSDNNIRRHVWHGVSFVGIFGIQMELVLLRWRTGSFHEYLALYMQQLGLSRTKISWTSLMGVLQLSMPLFGFLGDRFWARKLIVTVLLLASHFTLNICALSAMVTTLHLFLPRQHPCCVPSPYHGSSTSTFSIAS